MLMTRSELEEMELLENATYLWFSSWKIHFDAWNKKIRERWFQYDNLTQAVVIRGDLMVPDYSMELILLSKGETSIIPFENRGDTYVAILRREDLDISGPCKLQVRCTCGEKVRHTNVLDMYVSPSLA